jgi:hypothetical protein
MTGTTCTSGAQGPSVAEGSRHDALGRFVKGNPGGPGNPHHRKVAGLRQALLNIVTEEDVEAIARKLIDVAKEGSLAAIKLFLAYVIGKPGDKDVMAAAMWLDENDMPWMKPAAAKVDAASKPQGESSSPAGDPRGSQSLTPRLEPAEPAERIGNPSYVPLQADVAPAGNGGKRLTRQQRRALRRQAKGGIGAAAAKLNGDNGRCLIATPAEDPLAALARQRHLLR